MDDNLSNKSSDSLNTSGEYEMVPETQTIPLTENIDIIDNETIEKITIESKSPTLNYDGDFCDLKNDMTEVIQELDKTKPDATVDIMGSSSEYEFIFDGSIEITPLVDYGFTDIKAELMDAFQDARHKQNSDILEDSKADDKALNSPIPATATKEIPTVNILSSQEDQKEVKKDLKLSTACIQALKADAKILTLPIEAISNTPTLDILSSDEQKSKTCTLTPFSDISTPKTDISTPKTDTSTPKTDNLTPDINRVGQSVFYDCTDLSPQIISSSGGGGCVSCADDDDDGEHFIDSIPKRKLPAPIDYWDATLGKPQIGRYVGDGKPISYGEKCYYLEAKSADTHIDEELRGCTIFSGVKFLGAVTVKHPKSSDEIQRHMTELNQETKSGALDVRISIPTSSEGLIVLYESVNATTIFRSYHVSSILFYLRGPAATDEEGCFAFTWTNGESLETAIYQCHVFRCSIPEAVTHVSNCFSKAFHCYPSSISSSTNTSLDGNTMMSSMTLDQSGNQLNTASYCFVVSLSIGEKVGKESYSLVPRDRSCFKLRCNVDKEVYITVKQIASDTLQPLFIERCFGVLLSPGKLVRQADMQLLDIVYARYQKTELTSHLLSPFEICAQWNTSDKGLNQFNYECSKTFLTVAVDLVIKGIQEPVRFIIETPCTIVSQTELRLMDLWISNTKRSMSLRFYLQLKKTDDDMQWEVESIDPSEEITEQQTGQSSSSSKILKSFSKMVRSASIVSMEDDCPSDYSSDGDEPLLSGTGEVSKDCSQNTLDEWDPVLKEWSDEKRPKGLSSLVRAGIPEALRGKIWQKLANAENNMDITDMYRTLITKETTCEPIIQRDIHRTFPGHKRFKEIGGAGQDGLFKVSKAYAVYDQEVGYCQGLSFIAASLLTHMPEEDAFTILVSIMYDYSLRDLYKTGFENLYMRLYQLNRLIKDYLPKLHEHFERTGIETHMFASQWFLTLYTARFSLHFVYHVLDVFLLDGMTFIFQVAIALLASCESDLRTLDFEGILKYFRISLAKKFRSWKESKRLIKSACERKIRKLKFYEDEYYTNKKNEEIVEKQTKIYEEKYRIERNKLKSQLNDMQRKLNDTIQKGEDAETRNFKIVQGYKKIIQRQEHQITKLNQMIDSMMKIISKCKKCATTHEGDRITDSDDVKSKKKSNYPKLGPLDPLATAQQRIRELELELAQTKLAQVEAECKNQDLNHQLNTALSEIHNNKNSWQPWLSKTINTIQEKVTTRRDLPTFQSYTNPNQETSMEYKEEKIISGNSPKSRNGNQTQNTEKQQRDRSSVDSLPKDQPDRSDTLSFTSLK